MGFYQKFGVGHRLQTVRYLGPPYMIFAVNAVFPTRVNQRSQAKYHSHPHWSLTHIKSDARATNGLCEMEGARKEGPHVARSGPGANFRFRQEHRTFLSVNEFHCLTPSRH